MKQLGEYQTGWNIKMGNVLDFCNQRSTQQCTKSGVAKHLCVAGLQQQNGLVKETNVTLLAKVRCFLIQSGMSKVLWAEDTTMSTYLVNKVLQGDEFEVEPHDGHTFEVEPHGNVNHVVGSQEVISKWKDILKEDIDAQSDVYVLSNSCRKCSDDSNGYYWEYTPGFTTESWYKTLLEGHSILSLEGILSGDCDVEKNDVQVFVDFDYVMGRSITVMGRLITCGIHDTYGGCKGGYLAKGDSQ
ncbi:zinc finger, CCHC-type containing protein [Tanacetum coccineum]